MVSHRSGETEDNFIADLSVGLASGQVYEDYHCTLSKISWLFLSVAECEF